MGVARSVAAFHLDRLVADGLLTTEFRRLTGRQGPGAGRPAKLYRRAEAELSVSLPARQYDLAAGLLAAAVNDATRTGTPVGEALTRVATERGRELGDRARQEAGKRPSRRALLDAALAVLDEQGYEPRVARRRGRAGQLPVPRPGRRTARPGVRHEPRPAGRDGRRRRRRRAGRAAGAVRGQLLRPPRRPPASIEGPVVDWAGWAVFGLVATTGLTAVMIAAQLAGRTRLDLPLMLGTITTEDPDRARVAGFAIHLAIGEVFALFYAAGFAALDRSGWWLGALFGLAHAAIALTVLVPLLQGVHPRMASERAGPDSTAVLEPPGLFALNYGTATPLVAVGAHVVYGAVLGLFLGSQLTMRRPSARP